MDKLSALAPSVAALALLVFASAAQAVPQIQSWQDDAGAPVYFVAAPELEIIDVVISFAAGSNRDGDLYGISSMTAKLLDEGADGKDADSIAELFANNAASFASYADRDRMTVRLRSLSEEKYLQPVLQQMAAVLQRPDFPEQALQRERSRTESQIKAKQQSPGDLASERLYAAIYGDHPYAFPVSGTVESIGKIKRQSLQKFHKKYLTRANASVAIVGAVSRDQAEQIVQSLLAGLPKGTRAEPIAVEIDGEPIKQDVPFPSTQKHILLGHASIAIDSPDRVALYVGNRVLGSGMVSRLFSSIREKHGLAYSVYSYFLPLQSPGPFIVGMQTEASQAEKSVKLLLGELREYVKSGPSEQELADAKSYITGTFASKFSSNSKLADYLSWMAFYGLSQDYLDNFISTVEQLDVEQIKRSFKKHLRVDELQQIQLGGATEDAR